MIYNIDRNITSDERIQKAFNDISYDEAKQKIKSIDVKSYAYQDVYSHGVGRKNGFVAQQIEAVLPECVEQMTNFIPNILAEAKVTWDPNSKFPILLFEEPIQTIKPGDVLKIKTSSAPGAVGITTTEIMGVYGNTILIEPGKINYDVQNVFVIGSKVDDFKIIDTQQVLALLVKVVQGLV